MDMPQDKTDSYEIEVTDKIDGRHLINSKTKLQFEQPEYVQVFEDRNAFIPNLSILDLLFNEGTNAVPYLKSLNLNLSHA
jgi:hypothetical protein